MIPYLLAAVGGYLIYDSTRKAPNPLNNPYNIFANGGKTDGVKGGGYMADGGSTDVVNTEISTIKTNLMGTISFFMKIKGMKKPQDFIVYPISADQAGKPIMIQSDTRIGFLDLSSGRGLMSQSHPNGAYGYHFQMDKKVTFKINETDLQRLKDKISGTAGSSVGSRGIISDNSGANMMADGGMMAKGGKLPKINDVREDGKLLDSQMIDEGYISNAGEQEFYEYEGKKYVVTTWNDRAEEHKDGEEEIEIWHDEMARGGYVSKGELVWRKLSNVDRTNFLKENFTPEITPMSQNSLVGKDFNFLPKKVKIKLEAKYANVEDYAEGGEMAKGAQEKSFR